MPRTLENRRKFQVCMVAPFAPHKGGVTVQAELLTACLQKEGIGILRVDTNLQRLRHKGLGPIRLAIQPWVILFRLFRQLPKSDVVHFQSASYWGYMPTIIGVPLAKLFRKRCVITYQGGRGPDFMDRFPWLVKMPFRLATLSTVCSRELQRAFQQRGVQTELVKNLFDSELFKFRERTKVEPKLVWNRSMDEVYDPISALKVYEIVKERYPSATLVMTSNGALAGAVREYVDKHGLDGVRLSGRVPKEELAKIIDEADICLNTSKVDGLPTALLEAAASGLPIVTTKAGGIPYLFENGKSAVIVEIGDVEALSNAIIDLLENPSKALKMGFAARDVASEYTWSSVSKEIMRIYGIISECEDITHSSVATIN